MRELRKYTFNPMLTDEDVRLFKMQCLIEERSVSSVVAALIRDYVRTTSSGRVSHLSRLLRDEGRIVS